LNPDDAPFRPGESVTRDDLGDMDRFGTHSPGLDDLRIPDQVGEEPLSFTLNAIEILNHYTPVFIAAFLVTLLLTPLVRMVAIRAGIVDRPDASRKQHRMPVAYLGGVAVFFGLLAGIGVAALSTDLEGPMRVVPVGVVLGMVAITVTGLADDVWGWDPRLKIVGQLFAAAALALHDDIGGQVARGILSPIIAGEDTDAVCTVLGVTLQAGDFFKWGGTALIAIFVVGGCNAANLIDGLDGLLSGVTGIMALGLLAICVVMAAHHPETGESMGSGPLAGARVILCIALLGAVLGFLPHNFNPATIFLGDCGSLLLGFMCVVIILMLGDRGRTDLVIAGLIIFALPIMDTTLAILRRKLSGRSMSSADDQHIHHQIKRAVGGGVKKAVFALYGITALFALVGVTLAALVGRGDIRVRFIYAIALLIFGFVAVIAVKAARRRQIEESVLDRFGHGPSA